MLSDTPPNPAATAGPNPAAATAAPENQQPEPLPPRQEAFCHYFVLWGNASVAASEAGYARGSAKNQGYRLGRRQRIQARIAELRRGLARAYGLDAEVLVGKLEALYQRAVEDHHFHAAARCVEIQARIAGHVGGRFKVAAVGRPAAALTRSEDGPRGSGGVPRNSQGPDRDINKTTDDDFPASFPARK
ncbi:MAG: terminase small subunit [Proteobacteria bacterium]|nr:terminase small subunit [Pseudomonadota bacterium]